MARARSRPTSFRYVPAGDLDGRPHVIVDGAPRPGTVATLSHWPGTPTPVALWHDVSAGIVLRARARPGGLPDGVAVASIDHYDADGVIALGLLCVEGLADEHGALLVEAARVGDFDVVTDRPAALVAFALGALGDVEHAAAALGVPVPGGEGTDRTAWAAREAVRLLPALAAHPESYRTLWGNEADAFDASRRALSEGWASIEERRPLDLAIARVDVTHPDAARARVGRGAVAPRRGALEHRPPAGGHHRRGSSRGPLPLRVVGQARDAPTGAACRPRRRGDRAHHHGGGGHPLGVRRGGRPHRRAAPGRRGESSLDPEEVVELVCLRLEILDAGPPAWDPYGMPVRPA